MAARKNKKQKDLASQLQSIVADAVERVRATLTDELTRMVGSAPKRGPGRPPKAAAAKRGAAKAKGDSNGKPGRKPSYSPAQVDRLVDLVKSKGPVAPKDVRKVLKVSPTQMAGMVRTAVAEGRIKVQGAGRGTRYTKG
jgi:DNA replication initiation complex subunit (GINS family)